MPLISTFLRQSPISRGTLLRAAILLPVAQVALRVVSLPRARAFCLGLARVLVVGSERPEAARIAWSIDTVNRRLGLLCLPKAVAAQSLFSAYGYQSEFCIGASVEGSIFAAHAWIEMDDFVVIGGPASLVEKYTRFPRVNELTL